jgi:hypothetical protein
VFFHIDKEGDLKISGRHVHFLRGQPSKECLREVSLLLSILLTFNLSVWEMFVAHLDKAKGIGPLKIWQEEKIALETRKLKKDFHKS